MQWEPDFDGLSWADVEYSSVSEGLTSFRSWLDLIASCYLKVLLSQCLD